MRQKSICLKITDKLQLPCPLIVAHQPIDLNADNDLLVRDKGCELFYLKGLIEASALHQEPYVG